MVTQSGPGRGPYELWWRHHSHEACYFLTHLDTSWHGRGVAERLAPRLIQTGEVYVADEDSWEAVHIGGGLHCRYPLEDGEFVVTDRDGAEHDRWPAGSPAAAKGGR